MERIKIQKSNFLLEFDEIHLNEIDDIYNANMEVFITFEDNYPLTITLGTPKNLEYLMEKDKVSFFEPGLPWIIVPKLTKEIIEEAVTAYAEDKPNGYWFNLYHFAMNIDMAVFDQLQAKEIRSDAVLDLEFELIELKEQINKLEKLEKSEKLNLQVSLDELSKAVELLQNSEKKSPVFDNLKLKEKTANSEVVQKLELTEKYFDFSKGLLGITTILLVYQILAIFSK